MEKLSEKVVADEIKKQEEFKKAEEAESFLMVIEDKEDNEIQNWEKENESII